MQKMRTWKRVSAVMLTIAMLVGMLSMLGGLGMTTSAAVSEDLKFKADFSELAAIAEEGGVYADATSYRPGYTTETDKAIAAWVEEKFDMLGGYGKTLVRSYLGQGAATLSTSSDTYSGENYWQLTSDGSVQQTSRASGQMLRRPEMFVPKVNGERVKLANFEAKVTFAINTVNTSGGGQAIIVAFHEDTPATLGITSDYRLKDTGSLVVVGNGADSGKRASKFGMYVYDKNNTVGYKGAKAYASPITVTPVVPSNLAGSVNSTNEETQHRIYANTAVDGELFGTALVVKTKYDLVVRVVGTKVTTTVKNTATGEVVHAKEKTLQTADSGYFSVGSSNGKNAIYAVEIQELDEKGVPVPFGTATDLGAVETLKIDFEQVPEVQWYSGKYYYAENHDASDVSANTSMSKPLTAGTVTYTVDTKDKMLVDYLESKFAFYYSQEGYSFERPNVNGYAVNTEGVEYTAQTGNVSSYAPDTKLDLGKHIDGIGYSGNSTNPIAKWQLDSNKWLAYTNNTQNGDGMFRKSGSIAFKDKNGELLQIDNFKLDLDFRLYGDGTYDHNNIAVGFHANHPFFERTRARQAMFIISPFGGYFLGDNYTIATGETYKIFNKNTGAYDDYTYTGTDASSFIKSHGLTNSATGQKAAVWPQVADVKPGHDTELHLTLTVVGNTVTAKVTKDNGATVVLEDTATLSSYYGSGYLYLSGANAQGWYGDMEITRLDQNGNPVDFSDDNEGFTFGESFDAKATYYHNGGKYWRNTGADVFWMQGGQATNYTFDATTT